MKTDIRFFRVLLVLSMVCLLSGCRREESGAIGHLIGSPDIDGGSITLALPLPVPELDPFKNRTAQARSIYYLIYDNLIDIDQNLQLVPRLAKSWEISPDLMTITFQLRDDVHYHNEHLFTAEDVVYSFQQYKNLPDSAHPGHHLFENVAKLEVIDPYAVRATYAKPNTFALADWIVEILPKPTSNQDTEPGKAEAESPIGSGPYTFVRNDHKQHEIQLEVFEGYWNGRSHIDSMNIRFYHPRDGEQLLNSGEINFLTLGKHDISKEKLKILKKNYHLFDYVSLDYYYIGWQCDQSNPFFHHRRIRKAMTLAMTRKKYLNRFFQGKGKICDVPLPPWAFEKKTRSLPHSPRLAVNLVREVGCKDINGDGIRELDGQDFTFTLLFSRQDPYARDIAYSYQKSLRKIGIDMKLLGLTDSELKKRIDASNFDAYLLCDSVELNCKNLELFVSSTEEGHKINHLGYDDPQLSSLIQSLFTNSSANKSKNQINSIIDRVIQEQPCTFIFFRPVLCCVSPKIKMVKPCPRGMWEWYPSILDWYIPKELQKSDLKSAS